MFSIFSLVTNLYVYNVPDSDLFTGIRLFTESGYNNVLKLAKKGRSIES